jgi:hypothetical protein
MIGILSKNKKYPLEEFLQGKIACIIDCMKSASPLQLKMGIAGSMMQVEIDETSRRRLVL